MPEKVDQFTTGCGCWTIKNISRTFFSVTETARKDGWSRNKHTIAQHIWLKINTSSVSKHWIIARCKSFCEPDFYESIIQKHYTSCPVWTTVCRSVCFGCLQKYLRLLLVVIWYISPVASTIAVIGFFRWESSEQ